MNILFVGVVVISAAVLFPVPSLAGTYTTTISPSGTRISNPITATFNIQSFAEKDYPTPGTGCNASFVPGEAVFNYWFNQGTDFNDISPRVIPTSGMISSGIYSATFNLLEGQVVDSIGVEFTQYAGGGGVRCGFYGRQPNGVSEEPWLEPLFTVVAPPPAPAPAPAPAAAPVVTNNSPIVSYAKVPGETLRAQTTISYLAGDGDPGLRGLIDRPINIYYSTDNGRTWKELAKNEPNTGTYIFDTTKLPDSPNYKIKVEAVDGWAATGEAVSSAFAIDNTGPSFTIAISSTAPPPIKEKDRITLDITSSDDLKRVPEVQIIQQGAEAQTLVVSGARRKFSASYTVLKGYLGTAAISIKGEDLIGNIGTTITAGGTFSVGRLGPPPPVIEYPFDNQIFSEQKINVSGKAPLSVEVSFLLNGVEKFTTKPQEDGSFIFKDIVLSRANFGYNTLSLSGIDKDGIQSDETVIKVKLNSPPQISLTSKLEGTVSGQKKIEWLASDPNNDRLSYIIGYSIDGGKNWDNLVSGLIEHYYDFNTAEIFDCSPCRLKIIADDGTDRSEVISDEFAIKNNQSLSIFNIPASYLINTTMPSFEGQVSVPEGKLVFLKYSLDKEEWFNVEASDGKFDSLSERFDIKIPSPLIDGKHILFIQVKDDKENFSRTLRMFIVDTVPPISPTVLSPRPDDIMGKNKDIDPDIPGIQINISGEAEAGAELELFIHNIKYQTTATSKGEFIFSKVTLLSRGLNRFSLFSYDAVGNISKIDGSIISNNPPEVSILSPERGEFISEAKEIKWQAEDLDDDQLIFQIFYRPKNKSWIPLAQNLTGNAFEWNTPKIAIGEYELKIITNDGLSEAQAVTQEIFVDNKSPRISFDIEGPIFTNNPRFLFQGGAKDDFSGIQDVEYSFNNIDWYKALILEGYQTLKASFGFRHRFPLAEGDYKVMARATDFAGNIAYSEPLDLTIDTTPPRIGSNLISSGSLILFPDETGTIKLFKDTSYKILVSVAGDAKEVALKSGEIIFDFNFNKSALLWESEFKFEDAGDYSLEISARDEVGNSKTKEIAALKTMPLGFVYNKATNQRIEGAEITLYVFDRITNSWVAWDGRAFGQENPQRTDESGEYGFLVPPGKYQLEVSGRLFQTARSKELEILKNYLINIDTPLIEKKGIINKILDYFIEIIGF